MSKEQCEKFGDRFVQAGLGRTVRAVDHLEYAPMLAALREAQEEE